MLAIGKLSYLDGRCYSKAVSIIEVLAKYRTCVLLWDLELDALVVQMFQHFLNNIRPDHSDQVFMNIEQIMSMIIKESEEIPMQLLTILISSVKKENQNVAPRSYVLGEKVLQENAVKLYPYLPKAVRSLNISTNNYSEVFELIWREATKSKATGESNQFENGASKPQVENGPEEPCHEVACFDDVRPSMKETSKCLPDTDFKAVASTGTVVISVQVVDDSLKTPANNDSEDISHNATYDGTVGSSLPGSSKLPTNDESGELALHAALERIAPFVDQPPNLLGKDDPMNKDAAIVLEMGATLKESERGSATKQQKSTDSRTTSQPENLGFINSAEKELDPEATQSSKKRGWKPNFLNKPDEGYDHAWLSGKRRSKARILLKGCGKDTKKSSSYSPKCAISNGLHFSSGEEKTPIMTSIKRHQKEKNDKIGQTDGAQFLSISAGHSPGTITKNEVSQPTLVASEEFAVVEALEEKHEKDDKKNVPARYRVKRRRSSVDECGAKGESDQFGNGASKPPVKNGPEEPCREVACFDNVRPSTKGNFKCLPDTDFKVAASTGTVVISVRAVDDSLKTPVYNDSKELSPNATYDGKVGPSLPGSSKLPTNDESGELAPHAAPERVAPFLDQPPNLLGKDDSMNKDDAIVLKTNTTLKESELGNAMEQQKSTDSWTTSPPETLGFINVSKKGLDPGASQASKKRSWKPSFMNKPEEGYDLAWLSGEKRSKARILLKGLGNDTKKSSSCSPKCAISNGLYFSSGEEKTPIMTSIKRRRKEKNDKIGQNDGAHFTPISTRDSPGVITKKKVSQPSLVASEEVVVEALEEKHEKDKKKTVPAIYREKRRWSPIDESGAEAPDSVFSMTKESNFAKTSIEQYKRKNSTSQEKVLGSVSNTKESNFLKTCEDQRKRKNLPSAEALGSVSITKQSNFPKTSKEHRQRKNSPAQQEDSADKVVREHGEELVGCRVRLWWPLDRVFYEGQITFFDHSENKHTVIYEDGDQEMLNFTKERWELVADDKTSDPALSVDDEVPVLTPGTESKKTIHSNALYRGGATDDPTPPSAI